MAVNSPLDVELEELDGLELEYEEIDVSGEELGRFILRTFAVLLVLGGSAILVFTVYRRGRGSWKEVLGFCSVQIIWQVLAWYAKHVDANWVHSLTECPTVDCEYRRKIFVFIENLFHGVAVYSGIALVGRLEGLVGAVLWMLGIMSAAAPLLYAVIMLLLDLTLSNDKRAEHITLIGVAIARTVWFNIIPAGLLICWFMGQCLNGFVRLRSSSSRETASKLIAAFLIVFHLIHLTEIIVYVVAKNSSLDVQLELASPIAWLLDVGHLVAALAIPCAWLLGLMLPKPDSNSDPTEMNLKLAKQNKNRNIVKYKKEKTNVATPPTSPIKFKPEITSSPSVTSQETSGTILYNTDANDKKSKRSSYVEAVSSGSLHLDPVLLPPAKSKSADPLWLPTGKSLQV